MKLQRSLPFIIPLIFLSLLLLPGVNASDTLWESFTTVTPITGQVYSGLWRGQTFTVGATPHTVTSVKLNLGRTGFPSTMTVSIEATDVNGHPTGADLTSGTIATGAFGYEDWYEIVVPSYSLSASTKYAVVIRCPAGDVADYATWTMATNASATYADGNAEISTNSGSSWSVATSGGGNVDMDFQIFGISLVTTQTATSISTSVASTATSISTSISTSLTSTTSTSTSLTSATYQTTTSTPTTSISTVPTTVTVASSTETDISTISTETTQSTSSVVTGTTTASTATSLSLASLTTTTLSMGTTESQTANYFVNTDPWIFTVGLAMIMVVVPTFILLAVSRTITGMFLGMEIGLIWVVGSNAVPGAMYALLLLAAALAVALFFRARG